jgi:transcriptional regulator with XRE-family HTH domain
MPKTIHQGRNIKRFREMFGMKQDVFADKLGEDWSQKKVSLLEAKEEIDDAMLEQVAKALKVPPEAIKNFDEDAAINIVANTVTENTFSDNSSVFSNYPTFNPIDKLMEAMEEIKRLNAALIKEKDEKIALLERMLGEKGK